MVVAAPNETSVASAPVDASFDETPVTATVSPAPQAASATADTGFGDLGGPVQPSAPTAHTVAGTSKDPSTKSATDRNAISAFMRAVVPFPGEDNAPGYVNLHYRMPPDPRFKGKGGVPGWAFKTLGAFTNMAAYGKTQSRYLDFWQCMSLQRENNGANKTGNNYRAKRLAANAISLKSLWVDLDLGNDPKKYPDEKTALVALLGFCKKHALPEPSALVHTGNGLHAYWCNKTPIPVDDWRKLAEGLKALMLKEGILIDPVCTADAARLMRLPTTFNRKDLNNPKPVRLLTPDIIEHDFADTAFQNLLKYTPVLLPSVAKTNEHFDADAFKGQPVPAEFKGLDLNDKLSAGCEVLLDPLPIFKRCGFLKDALKTGGNGLPEPLWMLSLRACAYMEKGDVFAHELSKGDPRYSPEDTDAKYREQVAKGIGYPLCSTIKGAGCTACETCPLLGKIRSPLNTPVTAAITDTSQSSPPNQASWTGKLGVSLKNIPHRKWLYGVDLVRGEVTVIGSPGGAGKSSLAIGMAICIATNRELLGEKVRGRDNLKALVINGEDSTDEIRRRVYAFALQHGLVESDLGRLTVVGANDAWVQRISFLTTNGDKSNFNQDGVDALQLAIDALRPDVIVLDPLVSFCAGGNMRIPMISPGCTDLISPRIPR